MATQKRIYVVAQQDGDKKTEHLVRAVSPAQAINHVAKPQFSAEVASQDDVLRLARTHEVMEAGE